MPYFKKYPLPNNFRFTNTVRCVDPGQVQDDNTSVHIQTFEHGIVSLRANRNTDPLENTSPFEMPLDEVAAEHKTIEGGQELTTGETTLRIFHDPLRIELEHNGKMTLRSKDEFLGWNGDKSIFQFHKPQGQPFWGYGSKTGSLNKAGQAMKMWNSDIGGDMPDSEDKDNYDPGYTSIPFFITRTEGGFVGIYLDNTQQTYFNNGKDTNFIESEEGSIYKTRFFFGAYSGEPTVYFIPGASMAEVTKRFSEMTGRHNMMPLWALGNHQCRWSYKSADEVLEVVEGYEKAQIPLDTMWMDIDYMDDFKVFTWDKKNFPDPKGLCDTLRSKGLTSVAIIDPGIKIQDGNPLYEEGKELDIFCKNPNGLEFVGQVWPTETAYPDFTLPETREWWSSHIATFLNGTVDGVWIDMNDPATGGVDPEDMLFKRGTAAHHEYRNRYANDMAQATLAGIRKHSIDRRPFLLSRSAAPGIQQHAALWTGDNASNWEHLAMSIPQTLNLSLSGVPFNGPDVGGFLRDTTEELMQRWYAANFLFPFFRNHSSYNAAPQEPYRFSAKTVEVVRTYVNLRYKMLPYLYTLLHEATTTGAPMLRPLCYEFEGEQYESISDQFMVGEAILHAPIVTPESTRTIVLPPGRWFEYSTKQWMDGDTIIERTVAENDTPLFFRDGHVVPMLTGEAFHEPSKRDMTAIELHAFIDAAPEARGTLYEDDGATTAYKDGAYSLHTLVVSADAKVKKESTNDGAPHEAQLSVFVNENEAS